MDPVDRTILVEFASRVRTVEPRARIWAFGSRARGDAHPESDFDLCVVVPARTDALHAAIREIAWEISFERERVLTTIILSQQDFEDGPISASTLVRNILREGLVA
jgi:predicted nucleotidyltransferase